MVPTDESTQTNGLPGKAEPRAGLLDQTTAKEEDWTVESGMS
jgi:putative hydrolase of HD superfamily